MTKKNYSRFVYVMAGLSGMILGAGGGLVGVALPYVNASSGFTAAQISTVGAALILGTMPGNFLGTFVSTRFGRIRALQLAALLFIAAVPVLCLSCGHFMVMAAGLFLQGVSCGTIAIAGPMYLAECLPAEDRGKGAGMYQLILIGGLLLAMLIGIALSAGWGAADDATVSVAAKGMLWKAAFSCALVPGAALFLGTFLLHESPRWLSRLGRQAEALASLSAGLEDAKAKAVLDEILASDEKEKSEKAALVTAAKGDTVFRRRYLVPFAIVWTVIVCVQLTGWSLMQTYPVMIFSKAGLTGVWANCASSVCMAVMFVMTVISCSIIDRKGRKFLMVLGTSGLVLGLGAVGGVFLAISRMGIVPSFTTGLIVLAAFVLYVASFSIGPGVIAGLIAAEMLPMRIRAGGMLIATLCNGAAAWGIAQIYLPWCERFGEASIFFLLAGFMVFFFLTVVFFVPETKGKSLEEIEAMFDK